MCRDVEQRWIKIVRELPAEVLWLPAFLLSLLLLPVVQASMVSSGVAILLQVCRLSGLRGWRVWVQTVCLPISVFTLMALCSQISWIRERGILPLHVLAIVLLSLSCLFSYILSTHHRGERKGCSCASARQKALKLEGWRICKTNLMLAFPSLILSSLCACWNIPESYKVALAWTNVLLFSLWAIYKFAYLGWMLPRLEREHWIPVVDSHEQVVGLTPLSAPESKSGRLPVVRLMLIAKGMIFLEHISPDKAEGCRGVYDTPFASWLIDGNSPDEVAHSLLERRCFGMKDIQTRHLLHYNASQEDQPCVVYLFAAVLDGIVM